MFWRKGEDGLPGRRHCLIVARNVLTGEVKFFISNRVPGEKGVSLRWLLRVAFGGWSVESCFREAKDELGMDHYQVRGWRSLHRHFFVTQLSHLFCARVRQQCYQQELKKQDYHQRRNRQARVSHVKTRITRLRALGIDPDKIKSCIIAGPKSRPKSVAVQNLQ